MSVPPLTVEQIALQRRDQAMASAAEFRLRRELPGRCRVASSAIGWVCRFLRTRGLLPRLAPEPRPRIRSDPESRGSRRSIQGMESGPGYRPMAPLAVMYIESPRARHVPSIGRPGSITTAEQSMQWPWTMLPPPCGYILRNISSTRHGTWSRVGRRAHPPPRLGEGGRGAAQVWGRRGCNRSRDGGQHRDRPGQHRTRHDGPTVVADRQVGPAGITPFGHGLVFAVNGAASGGKVDDHEIRRGRLPRARSGV
jgi:hypothetical protein